MFFTKAALLTLALTFVANAFPILEETGSLSFHESHINITHEDNEGELQRRAKVPGLNPRQSKKGVKVFGGEYSLDFYRSGTNFAPYRNSPVADVLESWQEGTKKIRGPYVTVLGRKKLVSVFTNTDSNLKLDADHIFEAQTLGHFLVYLETETKQRWPKDTIKEVFLANHKKAYIDNPIQRAKDPDYTQDTYYGSLLQHIMAQMGSRFNLDRMALLSGDKKTNTRKGHVWSKHEANGDVEVAYDLARINNYMIEVKDGFCDTVNGIYKVLKLFYEARMDDPMDGLCGLFGEAKITPRTSSSDSDPPISEPATDSDDQTYTDIASKGYSDQDQPGLKPKYAKKQVYNFHDYFVKFMKKDITEAGDKMQKNIDKLLKSVVIPAGGDPLIGFKVTFPEELLKCSSLTRPITVRQAKGPINGKRLSSSSKACSISSTRTSSPQLGATSTATAKAPRGSTKTPSGTTTKQTSRKVLPPSSKTVGSNQSPTTTPCKKGKKC